MAVCDMFQFGLFYFQTHGFLLKILEKVLNLFQTSSREFIDRYFSGTMINTKYLFLWSEDIF